MRSTLSFDGDSDQVNSRQTQRGQTGSDALRQRIRSCVTPQGEVGHVEQENDHGQNQARFPFPSVIPRFVCPNWAGDEDKRAHQNTDFSTRDCQAVRSRSGAEEIDDACDAARNKQRLYGHCRRHVEIENLLHYTHVGFHRRHPKRPY